MNATIKTRVMMPRLHAENFLDWDHRLRLVLKRLEVRLNVELQPPEYLESPSTDPVKATRDQLKAALPAEKRAGTAYDLFNATTDIQLCLAQDAALVMINGDKATQYIIKRAEYVTKRIEYMDNSKHILAVIQETLSVADQQLVAGLTCPYLTYTALEKRYKDDDSVERGRYRSLLSSLKFENLSDYTIKFEEYLAGFKRLGGVVNDVDEVMNFICGLPDEYRESKLEHAGDQLDQLLMYYRKISMREKRIEQRSVGESASSYGTAARETQTHF